MNGHEPIPPVSFHSCHQAFIFTVLTEAPSDVKETVFFAVILYRQTSFFFEDFINSILQHLSASATISAHL